MISDARCIYEVIDSMDAGLNLSSGGGMVRAQIKCSILAVAMVGLPLIPACEKDFVIRKEGMMFRLEWDDLTRLPQFFLMNLKFSRCQRRIYRL
jgi:hypothetical protein